MSQTYTHAKMKFVKTWEIGLKKLIHYSKINKLISATKNFLNNF